MPWRESEVFPEGNGPISMLGGIALEDFLLALLKIRGEILSELKKDLRSMDQRLAGLEHDARQPRLAMEADEHADTNTRKRTEDPATAVQAMHGDSCSATRVDPGPKTNSTSFGVKAEPPAVPCRDDVLVENIIAALNSCLPSLEMRTTTAAGGLLLTGEISTATKTTFNQPPLRLSTEETNCKKAWILYVSYDSTFLPAAHSCRRVIETKSGENRMFHSGGSRLSPRLPMFGIVARVALWEVHVRAG